MRSTSGAWSVAAVRTTDGIAERAGTDVRVDVPEEPVVADVDGRRVERILRNLLVNAVEHGEGRPVEVCLRGDDNAVAVTVRDHGVGLRPGEAALGLRPLLAGRPVPRPAYRRHRPRACRSAWRTLACTVAGCTPGAGRGRVRSSG